MSVSVIVMGNNPASKLERADVEGSLGAGGVLFSCTNGCLNTSRVTIELAGTTNKFEKLSNAELKPAEIHGLSFPDEPAATAWLNARAAKLVGKTVFIVNPSRDPA